LGWRGAETLAGKKDKASDLEVFLDRAGRANAAIFDALAKESPQTIKQLLKQICRYDGLGETYYASLTKRLHALQDSNYIGEAKLGLDRGKGQKSYELRMKAHLAMFLKENNIQDILNKATDTQSAFILLALLNVLLPEKENQ
jgi:hypothetical protein